MRLRFSLSCKTRLLYLIYANHFNSIIHIFSYVDLLFPCDNFLSVWSWYIKRPNWYIKNSIVVFLLFSNGNFFTMRSFFTYCEHTKMISTCVLTSIEPSSVIIIINQLGIFCIAVAVQLRYSFVDFFFRKQSFIMVCAIAYLDYCVHSAYICHFPFVLFNSWQSTIIWNMDIHPAGKENLHRTYCMIDMIQTERFLS